MNVKRLICRWRGHKRDPSIMQCERCRMSDEEVRRGQAKPPLTWHEVDQAFYDGMMNGRAQGFREQQARVARGYSLGRLRAFREVQFIMRGPDARVPVRER